jgi:hypothetical protein
MSNNSEETTMNAAELGTQIDAQADRITTTYGDEMAKRIFWRFDELPEGFNADVDALRDLRDQGLRLLNDELRRLDAWGEALAVRDHRGYPMRVLLLRDGYRYSFADHVVRMLRRLEELPSDIGADALWKQLPTSKGYWLREEVEGNPYPHEY